MSSTTLSETLPSNQKNSASWTWPFRVIRKGLIWLRWLSQNIPLFTSGPAYILMLLACVPISLFLIGMALIEPLP